MASIAVQLSRLPDMDLEELSQMWLDTFGDNSPHPNNRMFMVQRIAYEVQKQRYGGVDRMTSKRLSAYAEDVPQRILGEHKISRPLPGTVIVRTWHGVEHRVVVLHQGFEYLSVQYHSLTEVARVITGQHCSGPLFFGLTRRGRAKS